LCQAKGKTCKNDDDDSLWHFVQNFLNCKNYEDQLGQAKIEVEKYDEIDTPLCQAVGSTEQQGLHPHSPFSSAPALN
jgi:hypothetical protein